MIDRLLPTTYLGPSYTERCMYCGKPVMYGTMVVWDDILDSWYCDNTCRSLHLKVEPQLMKLLEEDPNG